MRPQVESFAPAKGRLWTMHVRSAESFDFLWHVHAAFELVVIAAGRGQRFTGDHVGGYGPGDLTLFGPNLPHSYRADPADGPHEAYVVHFDGALLDGPLFDTSEFAATRELLGRAAQGVHVDTGDWLPTIRSVVELTDARQTLTLIELLTSIAAAPGAPLASGTAVDRRIRPASADTLTAAVRYLEDHFRDSITRDDVAAAVSMTPTSVSRLFQRQLGTSMTDYLINLRVGAASRSLTDTTASVAEIAHASGFANLANFNRHFRRVQGMSPRQYRRVFRGTA